MRTCRFCGTADPADFYDPSTTSGIAAGNCCKSCWVAKSIKWRQENYEQWTAQNHKRATMRKFSLTEDEYDALYEDPRCAGCGRPDGQERRFRSGIVRTSRLTLDHSHTTGKRRGLLCHDCNRTIATAHDDPEILRALASYLEQH